MFLRIVFLLVCTITITALQITPLKIKIEYVNPKYLKDVNISIKKTSRHSPYYLNLEVYILDALGNNVTVNFLVLEYISGRYIPTPFLLKLKLCDFLDEPLVGQTVMKAMDTNVRCPFSTGRITLNNLTFNISSFPYLPVFTYSDLRAQARVDINFTIPSTGEALASAYGICTITQSLESKSIKISARTPKPIN